MAKVIIRKLKFDPMVRALTKTRAFKEATRKAAAEKFKDAKNNLIKGFDSHPVTREIERGEEAANTSGTLGGYGNLYTFIGFYKNENPVEEVRDAIKKYTTMSRGKFTSTKNKAEASFTIKVPTVDELASVSPMPWEGGSWLRSIERGISGFGYYMYKKYRGSRSGSGFQLDNQVREGGYKPTKYYSSLVRMFAKEVTSIK